MTQVFFFFFFFIYYSWETQREKEAETQAEGEAGSMHREPAVRFDPGSPGSWPGPKAGAKPLHHPGIPKLRPLKRVLGYKKFPQLLWEVLVYLFFFFLRFYLFMRDTERERGRDTGRGRSRLHAGEPDVGLDPGTPGSYPGPKVVLNHWATWAAPKQNLIVGK